jgi:arylsulfatase A-like enzyme
VTQPNVVCIVTDDQPTGLLDAMPFTRGALRDVGINFTQGVSPSPLCAMSRSSFLTGRYAGQDLGIWANSDAASLLAPYEDQTLATALHDVGYHTGLFGKYMNGWSKLGSDAPSGWDSFAAIAPDDGGDGAYYDYTLQGTLEPEHHGHEYFDYSTDVLTAKSLEFIEDAPVDRPLFLYYSPYGAHANFQAAPRHIGAWIDAITLPPNFNEPNTGKAPWMRALPLADESRTRRVIKDQHETVMSVDDGVQQIYAALQADNRQDTLFLFFGDNGLMRGSHRLNGKYVPYKAATRLQMLARWDGHYTPGTTNDRITTPLDFTATIVQAAGATLPNEGIPIDQGRGGQFLEGGPDDEDVRPAYIGWRTKQYLYVQWGGGFEELYDYDADPYEMTNVAPAKTSKTAELRANAEAACQPRPPTWP